MNTVVWPSKKAEQNDLVRAGHEQLTLIAALEQQAKLECHDPMDGGIEPVRIMGPSRCNREDVTWPDRDPLSFDDVGAAAILDEDNLQKAMRVKPMSRGVLSADQPARIKTGSAPYIAQVFRRKHAGPKGWST